MVRDLKSRNTLGKGNFEAFYDFFLDFTSGSILKYSSKYFTVFLKYKIKSKNISGITAERENKHLDIGYYLGEGRFQ